MSDTKGQQLRLLYLVIQHDTKIQQKLISVMERLHEALLELDTEQVNVLVQTQHQLLTSIEKNGHQREQLLAVLGISADRQGMQRMLAQLPELLREQFTRLWDVYTRTIKTSHQLNLRNGQLMSQQNQLITRMLTGSPTTYGDSEPTANYSSRFIAEG